MPSDLFPFVLAFLRENRFEGAARAFAKEAAAVSGAGAGEGSGERHVARVPVLVANACPRVPAEGAGPQRRLAAGHLQLLGEVSAARVAGGGGVCLGLFPGAPSVCLPAGLLPPGKGSSCPTGLRQSAQLPRAAVRAPARRRRRPRLPRSQVRGRGAAFGWQRGPALGTTWCLWLG